MLFGVGEMNEREQDTRNEGDENETETDLPPEYCHYRDEGCEMAQSCLNCPLPKCIHDQPRGRQCWLQGQRDREMIKLFNTESKGIRELASRFSVSERTVQRALKRSKTLRGEK